MHVLGYQGKKVGWRKKGEETEKAPESKVGEKRREAELRKKKKSQGMEDVKEPLSRNKVMFGICSKIRNKGGGGEEWMVSGCSRIGRGCDGCLGRRGGIHDTVLSTL